MTVICGGGTSAPKAGVAETLILTAATMPGLLAELGIPWAVRFAGLLDVFVYDTISSCATDPPADPGITAADVTALLNVDLDVLARNGSAAKFTQLLRRFLWYQLCECTSFTTPGPPTPPAAPTGTPVLDPSYVAGAPAAPCGTASRAITLPGTNTPGTLTPNPTVPAGATFVKYTVTAAVSSQMSGVQFNFGTHTLDSFGSPVFNGTGVDSFAIFFPDTQRVRTMPLQPHTVDLVLAYGPAATPYPNNHVTVDLEFFCGGPAGGSAPAACCPPDPSLVAKLDQILGYVQLMQRQIAPFAYIAGTVHTGLTGSGQISVQGLVGAKILVTTMPSYVGEEAGDPTEYFELGWFAWGTADGFRTREFLTHAPHLTLPEQAGALTLLGYSWSPGVVVTITELVRES